MKSVACEQSQPHVYIALPLVRMRHELILALRRTTQHVLA